MRGIYVIEIEKCYQIITPLFVEQNQNGYFFIFDIYFFLNILVGGSGGFRNPWNLDPALDTHGAG